MIRRIPGSVNQVGIVFVVYPGCFKPEGSRSSSKRKVSKTKKEKIMIGMGSAEDLYKSF